jgi:RNA polymerase sigma-70 factor, ECF subfamily
VLNVKQPIMETIPPLRAFAAVLCPRPELADDLVQQVLEKAINRQHYFKHLNSKSRIRKWLFFTLHSLYYLNQEKWGEEVDSLFPSVGGVVAPVDMNRFLFRYFLMRLPATQREALALMKCTEFSCEEAAMICNCSTGTIRKRVSQAYITIAELMHNHPFTKAVTH